MVTKLASAIYNDIIGGLAGITSTPNISLAQLEDDCVDERLQIIKEYSLKGIVPKRDLVMSINCVDVDTKSLDKCPCVLPNYCRPEMHFEIPQIVNDLSCDAIDYLGSIHKEIVFKVYTTINGFRSHRYLRHGSEKPHVYIDTTPNANNMYDCWVFNTPLLKKVSIIFIPKDPRQLVQYDCCAGDDLENYTFISTEIKKRLTEKKLRYYRSLQAQPVPNTQAPH